MNPVKIVSVLIVVLFLSFGLSLLSVPAGVEREPVISGPALDVPVEVTENVDSDAGVATGTRSSRYIAEDFIVDKAQLTLIGGSAYDYAGFSIAFGDIDADGYDDLMVGSPYGDGSASAPRSSAGEVIVIFGNGNQTFPGTEKDIAMGQYDLMIYGRSGTSGSGGADSGCLAGYSLDSGDINGDGYDDIVIGAPGGEINSNRRDAGAVYVVYGRERNQFSKELDLASDLDFAIYGSFWETGLGRAVAVGNFDDDGYDDIIVGNQYASPNGEVYAGICYVVFGDSALGTHEDLWRGAISPDTIVIIGDKGRASNDEGDMAGHAVAAGNVNGDRFDDIIIGAVYGQRDGDRVNAGATYVILGSDTLTNFYNLSIDARVNIWGGEAYDYASYALAAGDVNGDKADDILIGAIYGDSQTNNKQSAGEMYIIYGNPSLPQNINLDTTYDVAVWGRNDWDILGMGIATGNLNGDEYDDFVVGARLNNADTADIADAGAAYIFYGSSSLAKNLDPRNDGDGQIYGDNESVQLGNTIAMGDFDNDGADDIAVMGYTADGPLNARDDCGEVYLVYGKAPPVVINSVELLDSTGDPVNTIYSKYDIYTFRVNITMIIGTADLKEAVLTLDPAGANLQYKYSTGSTPFSKVKDTSGISTLKSVVKDARTTSPFHYEIDFKLEMGWEYPTDGLLPVEVKAKGTRSAETTAGFSDVFQVEDDLEFHGSLEVWDEEGTQLAEGGWVAGGETIAFTGLMPVYEGTTDVYPPVSEYTVIVNDDTDSWTNATSAGAEIRIDATLAPATNPEDPFTISFSKPVTTSPRGTVMINLSVDGEMPVPPTSIEFLRVLTSSNEVTSVNSTSYAMKWPAGTDGFSGIRGYYYSLSNNEGTADGTFTAETNAELSSSPSGLLRYYIWPVDNAGNIGKAVSGTIFVDLDAPEFSSFEPEVGQWLTSKSFNCSVVIHDGEGAGIDTSTIRYQISTRGLSGYESWLTVTDVEAEAGTGIRATVRINDDFEEGAENYIKFKLQDEAGNNFESGDFNIMLDTGMVEYLDESPDSLAKQPGGDVVFEITIADAVSDVDEKTIQYKISTGGISGYGDWSSEDLYPAAVTDDEFYGVKYRVDLTLPSGKSNYIKFRAKDNAGNGYRESIDYRVWVNSPPQAVINSPVADGSYKENKPIKFSSAGSADADNDTLSYKWRSSIDGEFGFLPEISWNKLSPGIHEITLEVSDGISTQQSKVNVEIISKESQESTGMFGASQTVDLVVFIILIIIIALIAVLFLRSKKQLKEKEEEARRVTPELVGPGLPGVTAGPGMRPGVTDIGGYGLQPGAGGTAAPAYPQLPGTGAPQTTPTYDYGFPGAPGYATGVPGQPRPEAPVQTGVVAPAAPQLPPAVSAEYPHLNARQKLDLLEEKFLTGQISENLYMQLKNKYQVDMESQAGLATPPPSGEAKDERRETAAPFEELTFKRPGETGPGQVIDAEIAQEWGSEEDVLSKIQIPGQEDTTGPDLEKPTKPKVKKVKKR